MQTCVVHLTRASLQFVSYIDRKHLARRLKDVYTAATVDAAETALLELAESELGRRHPAAQLPPGRCDSRAMKASHSNRSSVPTGPQRLTMMSISRYHAIPNRGGASHKGGPTWPLEQRRGCDRLFW